MGWRKWLSVMLSVLLSVGLFGALVQAEGTLSPAAQSTSTEYYLTMVGARQGAIKSARKDGMITVSNFSHEVSSPRDAASGMATGRRQHSPLKIVKAIDKTSPLLYNALTTNEVLTNVTLTFTQGGAVKAGAPAPVYSIVLTNASISGIVQTVDESTGLPYEEISLTYQKIEWRWHEGNVTSQDSWAQSR